MGKPEKIKTELTLFQLLPNMLTVAAICLGLTAIKLGFQGSHERAVQLILLACVLDGLDGRVARLLNSDSKMGAELDSLADFLKYARNPTFAQLVDHESWSGKLGNRIPATQTRGALTTTMVTVQTNRGQERKFLWTLVPVRKSTSELGLKTISRRWRGAPETLFPHRLQQQRRPPDQGCWLVHECLYVENAIEQTL